MSKRAGKLVALATAKLPRPNNAAVEVQTKRTPVKPPEVRVTSGEKVQAWLISNMKGFTMLCLDLCYQYIHEFVNDSDSDLSMVEILCRNSFVVVVRTPQYVDWVTSPLKTLSQSKNAKDNARLKRKLFDSEEVENVSKSKKGKYCAEGKRNVRADASQRELLSCTENAKDNARLKRKLFDSEEVKNVSKSKKGKYCAEGKRNVRANASQRELVSCTEAQETDALSIVMVHSDRDFPESPSHIQMDSAENSNVGESHNLVSTQTTVNPETTENIIPKRVSRANMSENLSPVARRTLNFKNVVAKPGVNISERGSQRNSAIRVRTELTSPAKNRKSKGKRKVSILMEYNDDDMAPPTFYMEEDSHDSNMPEPLDLTPAKQTTSNSATQNSPGVDLIQTTDENVNEEHDSDREAASQDGGETAPHDQEGSSGNDGTPTARQRKMLPKDFKRKRSNNPDKWQRNVASKAFNAGIEHISTNGKLKQARVMGDPCNDNCNRCKGRLSHSDREKIFHKFWNLKNINRKRDFFSRHIKTSAPASCSTSPECAKKTSRRYFFSVDGKDIYVCKTMFLHTLGVVDCWIETSLRKCTNGFGLSPDKRGKHSNRPEKATNDTIESVKTHTNLFPRVPSHYSRERTKREYLETQVKSVERMYRLYTDWAKENEVAKPASASLYRKVFNTQFNLGFFLPKKDQCETCNRWKHAGGQEERRELVQAYSTHLNNKKAVKELKQSDHKTASETKCVAFFDTRLKEGHCFLWTETDAHKGPNEIGTNLLSFISRKVSEGVSEFSFYSDTPTGQNRNRMIFSLYMYASGKYNVNIVHRFLESGHSYSEADSMHARIEDEAKRVQEIFSTDEWINFIKNAKQDGKPYIVSSLKNEEVLDLHYLVDRQNWTGNSKNKIYWSQVREVAVNRDHPSTLYYRYNFRDEPSSVQVTMKTGALPDMTTFQFPSAYNGQFPFNKNKASDIRELCKKGAIPTKYDHIYERYFNIQGPTNAEEEEDF
ncbi:UPF0303 protein [Frankliniella fusca]|uniref:UPF0303 protein n=1 Tax=Frankliniella fusca TaxID=407009 RepID=A0AAE1GUI4_9NEOP|nr:UPF0303 protein [Frankliniella fusca]